MKQLTGIVFFISVIALLGCGRSKNEDANKPLGAQIIGFKWGEITVKEKNGTIRRFKDCTINEWGASEWDWSVSGMKHVPGILLNDVRWVTDTSSDRVIIILSKGVDEVLQVAPETLAYLQKAKQDRTIKDYHILQTEKAIKLYNELSADGEEVVGLFHSTC